MSKKKKILLSIVGILLLILITIGVTVALFTYTKLGTTENTITTGTMKFIYIENTGVGNGINITNAFPVSDQVGKTYNTENYVFDFKVEATNTGNEAIPYEVTLRKKNTSTLNENNVKIYLTDMTGDADTEIVAPTLYSDLNQTKVDVGNEIEKTLYNGNVNGGELTYEKNFRLRMWIKEDADYNEIAGQTFTAMVNVYSNVPLVEDSVVANGAEIKSIKVSSMNATKVEEQAYDYDLVLDQNLNNITIDVELDNPNATVDSIEKIDSLSYNNSNIKRLAAAENFNIVTGDNYFKITVTSEDKTSTSEYKLRVKLPEFYVLFGKSFLVNYNPIMTWSSNNAADTSGLYKSTDTNDGRPTYYFRGAVEENYIDFAGFTWRVVRVNEDGTIRIVMEESIGDSCFYDSVCDKDDFDHLTVDDIYYTNSELKTILETWYQENIIAKGYSDKVATPNNYFCEQAKVTPNTFVLHNISFMVGNANTVEMDKYTPDFKCEEDGNGYGIVNESIGLLTYDEVVHAGIGLQRQNTEFYLNGNNTWLMPPANQNAQSPGSRPAGWTFYENGKLVSYRFFGSTSYSGLLPVINLKADTTVTGEGTADSHWVVQ